MPLSRSFTDADAKKAGYYLVRELEQHLPGIYRRSYAPLWAQEDSNVIFASPSLDPGAISIIETVVEERGEAKLLSDDAGDVPMVEVSVGENKYQVFVVTLGYQYSMMQLVKESKSQVSINMEKAKQVDRGIREKTHQILLFGDAKRKVTGLFNDANVPITTSGYDANSASWQDHIDFVTEELARVSNRNDMTDDITTILIPNNLWFIWSTTYQTNDSGKTVMEGIRDTLGQSAGGSLQRIMKKNECRYDVLEKFGVRPAGTNQDRLVFLPSREDAVDRLYFEMDWLNPQQYEFFYKVLGYSATTECMIHYPLSLAYSDIPRVNPPLV